MTIPRLEALSELWETDPPMHRSLNEIRLMLRGYFGIKDNKPKRSAAQNNAAQDQKEFEQNLQALAGIMGQG